VHKVQTFEWVITLNAAKKVSTALFTCVAEDNSRGIDAKLMSELGLLRLE
jgi:hypothetical protein